MASLLGATVSMVNCVGDDPFGPMTIENLTAAGIDTRFVRRLPKATTGCAPIWVQQGGANRIVIVPGANDDVPVALVDEAFDHLGHPDVVVCQLEISLAATARAFERGASCGAVNILNPAPAGPIDLKMVGLASWLIPNELEFAALCETAGLGLGLFTADGTKVFMNLRRPRDDRMNARVMELGRRLGTSVAVTLGELGVTYWELGVTRVIHVPAITVPVVDTTGAGDAFVGAFAAAIAKGMSAKKAIPSLSHVHLRV